MDDRTKVILSDGTQFLGRNCGNGAMHVSRDGGLLAVRGLSGPEIPSARRLGTMRSSGLLAVVPMSASDHETARLRPALRRVHCIDDAGPIAATSCPPKSPTDASDRAGAVPRGRAAGDDLANKAALHVATTRGMTVRMGYLQYLCALAYLHAARGATDVPALSRRVFDRRVRIARGIVAIEHMATTRGGSDGHTIH